MTFIDPRVKRLIDYMVEKEYRAASLRLLREKTKGRFVAVHLPDSTGTFDTTLYTHEEAAFVEAHLIVTRGE